MNSRVHFVHISDTHIGQTKSHVLYGINTYAAAEKIVTAINNLPVQPDFVIHTGDVASNDGEVESYELAKELFSNLRSPVYYVSGNHDISANLMKILPMTAKNNLSDIKTTENAYIFNLNGITFITLDGRGAREIDPHGIVSEKQLNELKNIINNSKSPIVIFIHFPPVLLESTWLDRDMLLLNGSELHEIIMKAGNKILGIFFGHVHRGMTVYRDGVLYSSVGSSFCQFSAWPGQEMPIFDPQPVGFFNFVSIGKNGVLIKEHQIQIQ